MNAGADRNNYYVMPQYITGSGLNTRTGYRFYPLTICVNRVLA